MGSIGKNIFDLLRGELFVTDKYGKVLYFHKGLANRGTRSTSVIPLLDESNHLNYRLEIKPALTGEQTNKLFNEDLKNLHLTSYNSSREFVNFLDYWDQFEENVSEDECPHYQQLLTLVENIVLSPLEATKHEDQRIATIAKMDHREFGFFYDKYFSYIFNYLARRVNSKKDAEDLAHDTFYQAFTHLSDFHIKDCSYRSYLMTIAHNLLVNYYRHYRQHLPLEYSFGHSIDEKILENLQQREIWQFVEHLSPIEQTVITMFYIKDFSANEIADRISKSANAIKLILSHARKKLRKQILIIHKP